MADGCTDVLLGCCDDLPPPPPLPAGYYYIAAYATNRGFNPNPYWPTPSRTRYMHKKWHVENGAGCPFPNDRPVTDGEQSVDPSTGIVTTISSTGIIPGKASAANTVSEAYSATADALTVDIEQYCSSDHGAGTSKIHIEFSQGIGDAEMVALVNGLLSQCSFSDFSINNGAGAGIWKMAGGCDSSIHVPEAGCVSRNRQTGDTLLTAGEAGWSVGMGVQGTCVEYIANRLLIVRGNANTCLAKFNYVTGQWSNFLQVDASDYFEVSPPPPDLTIDPTRFFNWSANKGYRNPFAIFPPNTPCP